MNNSDFISDSKMISSACLDINTPVKEYVFTSAAVTPIKENFLHTMKGESPRLK